MMRAPKRQRRPIFPFGDMMLPVLGAVALGILVFGVRVFFLPEKDNPYEVYVEREKKEEKPVEQPSPHSVYQEKPNQTHVQNEFTEQPSPSYPMYREESQTPSDPIPQEPEGGVVVAAPIGAPTPAPASQVPSGHARMPEPRPVHRPAPPKPQPKAEEVSAPSSGSWLVQIGAFKQKKVAMELISTVRGKGYKPTLGEGPVSGVTYYKVWIPGGTTRESAVAIGEKLARAGYEYFVFPKR